MAQAYMASTPQIKQKAMKKCLKRVRRLNNEIKEMEVNSDLKQNHSVLLYSLRMLEARLVAEQPPTNSNEVLVEQGSLEEFLGDAGHLVDVDRQFEEQLAKDLTALQERHDIDTRKKVARL